MDKKAVRRVCLDLSYLAGQLRTAAGVADLGFTGRVSVSGEDLAGRAADLMRDVQMLTSAIAEDEPAEGGG